MSAETSEWTDADQDLNDWYPPNVAKQCFIFSVSEDKLPANPLLMPTVGNGHIAGVIYRDRLFMNGFYNGVGKRSHRAAIPSLNHVRVKAMSQSTSSYTLDCIKGIFTLVLKTESVTVSHITYCHRTIPNLMVNEITVIRGNTGSDITIELETGTQFKSPDIKLEEATWNDNTANTLNTQNAQCFVGTILETEVPGDTTVQIQKVYICMDELPGSLRLPSDVQQASFTYIMSVSSSQQQCVHQYNKGRELLTGSQLCRLHCEGWAKLWQSGRIDIWSDDLITSQTVYGCQYYIMSSLPSTYESDCLTHEFYGLSPESLAYGDSSQDDYLGHVFWDQETWMYPPVLLLRPDIAEKLIQARLRVVGQAKKNAESNGMKGAQFPWEQGVTGIHVSPSDDCEKYELHINADIALALRHFIYETGEASEDFVRLAAYISEYWVSRLTWMEDKQKYGILDVMPPDEFHYPVNNSSYTNLAAQLAISLPNHLHLDVRSSTGSEQPPVSHSLVKGLLMSAFRCSDTVSDVYDIYVPFDNDLQYHPEFDGYNVNDPKSSKVKQADVVLIGYPLDLEPSRTIRQNDLEMYEKVTTINGPAMTWSMFCIGHLELSNYDKAADMFKKQLLQTTQPYQVWSEYPGGDGAINFITGMGGFLQSLLNGYIGVRLKPDCMRLLPPTLPPNTSRLQVSGLSYKGMKFVVNITDSNVNITPTRHAADMTACATVSGVEGLESSVLTMDKPFNVEFDSMKEGLTITVNKT